MSFYSNTTLLSWLYQQYNSVSETWFSSLYCCRYIRENWKLMFPTSIYHLASVESVFVHTYNRDTSVFRVTQGVMRLQMWYWRVNLLSARSNSFLMSHLRISSDSYSCQACVCLCLQKGNFRKLTFFYSFHYANRFFLQMLTLMRKKTWRQS